MNQEKQILEIVKQKDDYAVSVEISENSKQEPCVTIKSRSDDPEQAVKIAVEKYNSVKESLKK